MRSESEQLKHNDARSVKVMIASIVYQAKRFLGGVAIRILELLAHRRAARDTESKRFGANRGAGRQLYQPCVADMAAIESRKQISTMLQSP